MLSYTGKNGALHARYLNTFDKLFLDAQVLSSTVLFDDLTNEEVYRTWERFTAGFMIALRNSLAYQGRAVRQMPHLTPDTFLEVAVNQRYKANYISYELPVSLLWVRINENTLLLLGKDIFSGQLSYGCFNIERSEAVCGVDFTDMEAIIDRENTALFDFYFPRIPQ